MIVINSCCNLKENHGKNLIKCVKSSTRFYIKLVQQKLQTFTRLDKAVLLTAVLFHVTMFLDKFIFPTHLHNIILQKNAAFLYINILAPFYV